MQQKLIILDRDGVINEDRPTGVCHANDFILLPNSLAAIVEFAHMGYTLAIATNQSCIGRGRLTKQELQAIHNKLQTVLQPFAVQIAKICFCPHTAQDLCLCRKPKPGMLLEILEYFHIQDVNKVFFVGDSLCDLQAAQAIGINPVLVQTGHGANTLAKHADLYANVLQYADLLSFADYLSRIHKNIN